jgi:hypothetical protein
MDLVAGYKSGEDSDQEGQQPAEVILLGGKDTPPVSVTHERQKFVAHSQVGEGLSTPCVPMQLHTHLQWLNSISSPQIARSR